MGFRTIAALALILAGCQVPEPVEPDGTRLVLGGPAPAPPPAPAAAPIAVGDATFFVAGCNVECVDCAVIDSDTYVIGRTAGRAEPLFAGPPSPGAAYSCSASVPVGETVVLEAHGSPSFEFVTWRQHPATPADYCPCAGSSDPTCRVTVAPEVAASYGRAYCGAVWRTSAGVAVAR
jgi:hypothetical protein